MTASSAFPPFLSPCTLDLRDAEWITEQGNDLADRRGFRDEVSLCDGGVYDNLGVETAWKRYRTVLVSDAGGLMGAEPDVPGDWGRGLVRVLSVIDNQVRALRKQQVVGALRAGDRDGMYVGIRSDLSGYPVPDPLDAEPVVTMRLADLSTRLDAMPEELQELLINWGYVVADAGIRSYVDRKADRGSLPYPAALSRTRRFRVTDPGRPQDGGAPAWWPWALRGAVRSAGKLRQDWHYVVVEEVVGATVELMSWPWPLADSRGRLFWAPDAEEHVMTAAVPQRLVRLQLYRPNQLLRRPRAGDTFAAGSPRRPPGGLRIARSRIWLTSSPVRSTTSAPRPVRPPSWRIKVPPRRSSTAASTKTCWPKPRSSVSNVRRRSD